ncbi:MAG: phosphate acyltransferase, partial [Candidatus Woesearchaeota archaeon]
MNLIEKIKSQAKSNPKKILLVEGDDERIIEAAKIILKEKIAKIVILEKNKKINLNFPDVEIINIKNYDKKTLANKLYELRKHKGMTLQEAEKLIENENYFATMLLKENYVDGLVSGAIHTTSETIRPALQIIKTKENVTTASSYFLMSTPEKDYFFADCAFVKNPTADELATIAISTAESIGEYGVKPKIAMLSFSTKG